MASSSRPPLTARRRLILIVVLVLAAGVAGLSMVLAVRFGQQDNCLDAGGRWVNDACEGARPGG